MRHKKDTFKIGHSSSHRRAFLANMLRALIVNGRIKTTLAKAKHLRRYADRMVTLAKKNSLASRRQAVAELMISYNTLSPQQSRAAKEGDISSYNDDRRVIKVLFDEIGKRFESRNGGYTRIIKKKVRTGDSSPMCFIEYLAD